MISRCAGENCVRQSRRISLRCCVLQRGFRVVRRVLDELGDFLVQLLGRAAAQRRERLVAGDRQQPGRHLRARLEPAGLPPHVDEHLAHQVLGRRFVVHEAQKEPVNVHIVASEQNLQGLLVALGDQADQRLVGRSP